MNIGNEYDNKMLHLFHQCVWRSKSIEVSMWNNVSTTTWKIFSSARDVGALMLWVKERLLGTWDEQTCLDQALTKNEDDDTVFLVPLGPLNVAQDKEAKMKLIK